MKIPWARLVCLVACTTPTWAQKQTANPAAPTATVSGHVYCADTNAPARMATVILQPADAVDAITPGEPKTISSSGETAQTSMDGSFTIQHVAPGTYYVIASQAGYISPLAVRYMGADDPLPKDQKKEAPPSAPRITVEGNLPVAVNVTIERGAGVSGNVLYDDGSPASGIQVSLLTHEKNGWTTIMFSSPVSGSGFFVHTDDQGHYRLTGLPAGKYLLQADLRLSKTTYKVDEHGGSYTSSGNGYSLEIYNGSTMREKDAEPFDLTLGEERRGVDIEIPVSKLHTVRGNILAAHDGHVLNGGSLQLLYPDDKSMVAVTALTDDDDIFNFSFVPEGDYILRVDGASDVEYREISNGPNNWPPTHKEPHVLHQYGPAEQPIHITGDLSAVTISAPDLPTAKAQPAQ
ncbi:MSCRAMM family protein [Occallatibacter riparius]|uniref:Carboxypeptidase-like regulatory domain-containing protein n=1 Tax=Occallatibacter riparius TaxID=1002689 RepID=A0A9J7BUD5_9BACT|nr:carboxypeptidase-like regulatory domain-containing protein [Occallatibacter riparius]UWZ86193.1 carboxypeptidase-like regulatory domain-containing protein [Occallatibacter riparius]